MRKITVEVPGGELADLERITLVEADAIAGNPVRAKTYKMIKTHKSPGQGQFRLVSLQQRTASAEAGTSLPPRPGTAQPLIAHPSMQGVAATSRDRRRAALSKVFGILKGRQDAPQDGLAFQLELRAE